MSGKPTDLGYKKDIGRCKFCQETILWGYMFGKKHPYDVIFDEVSGDPQKNGLTHGYLSKMEIAGIKSTGRCAYRSKPSMAGIV